jgi:hypothetical protein
VCRGTGWARLVRERLRGLSNEGGGTRRTTALLFVGCGVVWSEEVSCHHHAWGFTLVSQNT